MDFNSSKHFFFLDCCYLFLLMPVLTLPMPDFLREDTPVGTSFLRAAAHDDDQGTNAAITYSLSQQNPAYFHINPSTGWIYVNHPISQVHIHAPLPSFQNGIDFITKQHQFLLGRPIEHLSRNIPM